MLITCNSIFTILMEVAIVMEMRQSCSQCAPTTPTPHPCITPVCVGILYSTLQHKGGGGGGGANASADSSGLIFPRAGMDLKTNGATKADLI